MSDAFTSAVPTPVSGAVLVTGHEQYRDPIARAEQAAKAFLIRFRMESTRDTYAIALRQFFAWCDQWGVDPLEAKRPVIDGWARDLEAQGRKPSTVAGKLNVLSSFFGVLVADEVVVRNPMLHVTRPNVERKSTSSCFTRSEINNILEAAEKGSPQDHALIALLAHTGLRIGAVLGINVEDIVNVKGQLAAEVYIKGGRSQLVAFAPNVGWVLTRLLEDRGESGPLFQSLTGARLCRNGASRVVKRIAKAAGVKRRAHPHAFRKTVATLSRNAGIPDREIIAALGWLSPSMLGYYDGGKETLQQNHALALSVFIDRAA